MTSQHNSCIVPCSIPDSFFSDLEQDFSVLLAEHENAHNANLNSLVTTATPPSARLRSGRKNKNRKPKMKSRALLKPSSLRIPVLRSAKISGRELKTLSVMAVMVGLSAVSYHLLNRVNIEPERPVIQKVMYQNAQTKVAAFRKEIAEGEHFVAEQDSPIQYLSKSGDTINKISKKYHVSPNTIIKNNDSKKIDDILTPGTKLTILPVDGISHPVEHNETLAELSKRYDVGIQEIVQVNHLDNPHMITEKQKIIIPNATELKHRPKPKLVHQAPATRNGDESSVITGRTGSRLSWPSAGVVTSNYGWRWFRMHSGMDVAGPIGTPIKAAKEGRVVYAGWMGGYGYAIDIEHGSGIRTRYAHCSSLSARVGQTVQRGQVIGAMGSTGHSTGPHLHFEVHVGGAAVDPKRYF